MQKHDQAGHSATSDPREPLRSADRALLADREAANLLGISRATFWRRVSDRSIPPPIKLAGVSRWRRDELLAVIDRLTAERDRRRQ